MKAIFRFIILSIILVLIIYIFNFHIGINCFIAIFLAFAGDELLKQIKIGGFIFRPYSLWVGLHYSRYHKKFCLNILPCCTLWWIKKGGDPPLKGNA